MYINNCLWGHHYNGANTTFSLFLRPVARFEREIQTTSTTKWDRVAFAIKDKKSTPVLVEFSGGVKFNTTDKKEQVDERTAHLTHFFGTKIPCILCFCFYAILKIL
ncbi:MAG: hypothetical protein EXX96DRAFT_611048 [Benjaminiella poitrasii]|nr:MAG: hypothetical protein EXX96DRAFT_611048 [Benjaminiella poitrasii]